MLHIYNKSRTEVLVRAAFAFMFAGGVLFDDVELASYFDESGDGFV